MQKLIRSKKFYEYTFLAVLVVSFTAWIAGIFFGGPAGRQFDLFFSDCKDFFADMVNVVGYSGQKDPYHNLSYSGLGEKAYPPLNYVITYLFSKLVDMDWYYEMDRFLTMYQDPKFLIIYLVFITAVVVAVYELVRTYKNGSNGVKVFTAAAVCASGPMIYSYERGNLILLTLACVLFFIAYYDSRSRVLKELALIALAVAAGLKMTPAVLGILLLYNKQWREAVRAVIYGIIFTIGPFLFFEGGLSNISQMFLNLSMNLQNYTAAEGATLTASVASLGIPAGDMLIMVMKWVTYGICLILLISALVYKNKWEMIMAVSVVLVIAPSHSGSYCILYLIPAIIAFLNAKEHPLTDLFVLFGACVMLYGFQSTAGDGFFNYHLSVLLFTGVLTVRGIVRLVQWGRGRTAGKTAAV